MSRLRNADGFLQKSRRLRRGYERDLAPGVIVWPAPREKFQGQPGALERQALRVGFGDNLLGSVGMPNGSRLWLEVSGAVERAVPRR